MNKDIEEYFYWTRRERNGVVILLALIIAVWSISHMYEYFYNPPPTDFTEFFEMVKRDSIARAKAKTETTTNIDLFAFNPNTATEVDLLQLQLPPKVVETILKYRSKGGHFYKKSDLKKIYGLTDDDYNRLEAFIRLPQKKNNKFIKKNKKTIRFFNFDPNTATVKDFTQLGLSSKIANNIIKYRQKGGYFRTREDFKKIYGMKATTYNQLAPYISIAAIEKGKKEKYGLQPATTSPFKKPTISIDINKASVSDWQQLKGIGGKRAERIVKFRDKLGGFSTINQVAETWGLPDSIFRAIKPHLHQSPILRKININTVSFKALLKHPLFDYNKTQIIINYRKQHGDYHSMEDIRKVGGPFSDSDFDKIAPYLSFHSKKDTQ